jgi:hypothetical protein
MAIGMIVVVIALPVGLVISMFVKQRKSVEPTRLVELRSDDSRIFKSGMVFTFWKDAQPPFVGRDTECFLVSASDQDKLLQDSIIEAPPGCTARTIDLHIRLEDAKFEMRTGNGVLKTETTYSYKPYVVDGQWIVSATDDCPPGELTITIRFPAIEAARKSFGAQHPKYHTMHLMFRKV